MISHAKLSEQQQKVYDAFGVENKDIDLVVLYTRALGDPGDLHVRDMQMKLAPIFSAINAKLIDARIEPGYHKRTYRITTKGQ